MKNSINNSIYFLQAVMRSPFFSTKTRSPIKQEKSHSKNITEKLQAAITYYENHQHQMNYSQYREKKYPIGSGVTEAACKTLVKQRLCCSGMRWKEKGAGTILSLRALVLTKERWRQFWAKLDQYGFPIEP